MSRRSGQNGTVVIAGKWYRVRWRMDVEGQEERINMNQKVAPLLFDRSGKPKPPSIGLMCREGGKEEADEIRVDRLTGKSRFLIDRGPTATSILPSPST